MKKILFWSAVTILAAVSCNKLENDTPTQSNVPAFEAYVDGAESKTVIDGMASYWDGTERIWVLNGQSGNASWKKAYKATATKAARVTFKEENNVMLTGDDYLAVYPAEPAGDVTWDGKVSSPAKKFWLPGDQIAKEGTYDPSTHVAVAYTLEGNPNLEFKNVTSLVKFTLQSDNVSEVVFYGLNNDVITGNFDVTYNNGNPTYTTTGSGYSKNAFVRVKPTSGNLTKGKTYYMSVLPRTFSKGFAVEMLAYGAKGTMKNSKSYTLDRNQILELGNITWTPDEDATFTLELDTDNLKEWYDPYLYVWTDSKVKPLGDWPGTKMNKDGSKATVKIPKQYIGKKLNYIVNSNGGWQTGNLVMETVWATQSYKANKDFGLK